MHMLFFLLFFCRFSYENSYPAIGCFLLQWTSSMQRKVLFLFDFYNFESLRMHELLMLVAGMRLKSNFRSKVFALMSTRTRSDMSMGNDLLPSPQMPGYSPN